MPFLTVMILSSNLTTFSYKIYKLMRSETPGRGKNNINNTEKCLVHIHMHMQMVEGVKCICYFAGEANAKGFSIFSSAFRKL